MSVSDDESDEQHDLPVPPDALPDDEVLLGMLGMLGFLLVFKRAFASSKTKRLKQYIDVAQVLSTAMLLKYLQRTYHVNIYKNATSANALAFISNVNNLEPLVEYLEGKLDQHDERGRLIASSIANLTEEIPHIIHTTIVALAFLASEDAENQQSDQDQG